MSVLIDRVGNPALPFDLQALKTHVRYSDNDLDAELERMGRAAADELEQFAQVALLTQTIRVNILDPVTGPVLRLPIGPTAFDAVPQVTLDGMEFTRFDFIGGLRPTIRWREPYIPYSSCHIQIDYQAGFGADHTAIPADLMGALLDQAALMFDNRGAADNRMQANSPHFARVGARYRGVMA